jgi:WD40 repeat protein
VAARFDAFISYSRAASSTLAAELRNGIERFAKPWYRLRSSRVFLDDASMSANTGLWSTIERGLTESDWFILLCSPRSAASQYVTNEIAWWLEHKSSDRILLVLDEGEMLWDAKAGDFDWPRASAVNRALSKAFAEEPRWVDLSWFEQDGSLRSADPRFTERVADLASAVRGIERDELVGENVRERRRAIRLLRGGVIALSGLLIASLAATAIAVVNGNAAAEQARIAQARQLAAQAIALGSTDLRLASLLATEAVRMNDDAQTEAALFQLQNASPFLERSLDVGAEVTSTAITADGEVVLGDAGGTVSTWTDGERTDLMHISGRVSSVAVSDDGSVVAAVSALGREIAVWTGSGGEPLPVDSTAWTSDLPGSTVAVSADGMYLAVSDYSNWTALFHRTGNGWQLVGNAAEGGALGVGADALTVFQSAAGWVLLSLTDLAVLDSGEPVTGMTANVTVSADGSTLAGPYQQGINFALWKTHGSAGPAYGAEGYDQVATSAIAGALDLVLDEDGSRLATQTDGAIYVSQARDPSSPPEPPIVLDGAGRIAPETLSFRGEHLVNGSGDLALVWDLTHPGRITTEFPAPVPEPCTACGEQLVRINATGTRLVMTDLTGFSTVVTDLRSQKSVTVPATEGGTSYVAASWFDENRIVVSDPDQVALQVLSGPDYSTVDLTIPLDLPPDARVLAIRADGTETGRVTVFADNGHVETVDLADGAVVVASDALAAAMSGSAPAVADIAPDQSTAVLWDYDPQVGMKYVDLATDRVLAESVVDGVAYDGSSRLHIFVGGSETVLDPKTGSASATRPAEVESIPPPVLSPDGSIVVSGGQTGVVTLIDIAARGTVVGRIAIPTQDGQSAISVFSPDGDQLITTVPYLYSQDRAPSIRIMDLTVPGWIAASCAVAGRDLTPAEWQVYVGTTPPGDLRCDR